jgi:hypothetical protein
MVEDWTSENTLGTAMRDIGLSQNLSHLKESENRWRQSRRIVVGLYHKAYEMLVLLLIVGEVR